MDNFAVYLLCASLMEEAGTPERARAHSRKVAEFALRTAQAVNGCGEHIEPDLVYFSALLHDVKRTCPDHAAAGASFVREKGYPAAAEIIARHMDLGDIAQSGVDACEIVYLADKVTREDGFRTLADALAALPAEKKPYAQPRLLAAMEIQRKVEAITGRHLEEILGVAPAEFRE